MYAIFSYSSMEYYYELNLLSILYTSYQYLMRDSYSYSLKIFLHISSASWA